MFVSTDTGSPGFLSRIVDRLFSDGGASQPAWAVGAGLSLSDQQIAAVGKFLLWMKSRRKERPFFYIAGFAGTGKSTITKSIIEAAKSETTVKSIIGAAFTAKAAAVLRQKTGLTTMTIHAALYQWGVDPSSGKGQFTINRDGPAAKANLLVVDEVSMVNEVMAHDLLSLGVPLLVLGDPGQLRPIKGYGYFIHQEPDVFLTEVHRQSAESPIVRLSKMVREKILPPIGVHGRGVTVLPLTKETQILVYRPETQPLCGIHRVRWTYSQRIRRLRGFEGTRPQAGEPILWRRNLLKEHGLCNGMVGVTSADAGDIGDGTISLAVHFDDLDKTVTHVTHPFLFDQHFRGPSEAPALPRGMGAADWGYLLTGHASQGSEFEDVTVIDDSSAFGEDKWAWLYTTITRSSRNLTVLLRQ